MKDRTLTGHCAACVKRKLGRTCDALISVSMRFAEDGVVSPSNIKRGVFTTGAVDNIDESGRTELHGTAISLTNHLTHENTGISPPPLRLDAPEHVTVNLPGDFAIVPYIDEYAGEITLSTLPDGSALPTFTNKNSSGDEIANVNFYAVRPEGTRIR